MSVRMLRAGLLGAVIAIPWIALSYLFNRWGGLPFPPFDLLDAVTRLLPGSIVTAMIHGLVGVLTALDLGELSATAKAAERMMAISIALLLAGGLSALGALLPIRRPGGLIWQGLGTGLVLSAIFSLMRAALAAARPSLPADYLWVVALGLAWGLALGWLQEKAQQVYQEDPPATMSRRQFLTLVGGGVLTISVGSLALADWLESPEAETPAPLPPTEFDLTVTSGPAASPPAEVLQSRIPPVAGTRPEITATEDFYTIDINTRPPSIQAKEWELTLEGMVSDPLSLTLDELRARTSRAQVITLSCISNPIGGDLISTGIWRGVPLAELLAEAGVQPGASHLYVEAADGFYENLSLDVAMDPRTLLVYEMNGEPLPEAHGFPLRIYIPDRYGMKQPKWITRIEVRDSLTPGYWVERGWSREAKVQTTSVIDTTRHRSTGGTGSGTLLIGGIAYAGARGIRAVEVQIDDGDWQPAQLRHPPLSPLTWVLWRYEWPAQPGSHIIRVRAYDGAGKLQITTPQGPRPDGAVGVHEATIRS